MRLLRRYTFALFCALETHITVVRTRYRPQVLIPPREGWAEKTVLMYRRRRRGREGVNRDLDGAWGGGKHTVENLGPARVDRARQHNPDANEYRTRNWDLHQRLNPDEGNETT